jgi:pimeloyl-ACP methyl ester carboxylesterase
MPQVGKPEPFEIRIDDAALEDLRARLQMTRWPHALAGVGWSLGSDRDFVKDLVARWIEYDWRPHERALNGFRHYRAPIDGLGVHFIHERGRGPAPVPILLGHGCFSSFYEFHRVIRALADPASCGGDPADAFDVVVWSLPGFGFSDKPAERGWGCGRMADAAHALMRDVLGYERYGSVGGSWGGTVAWRLGMDFADASLGLFLTQTPVSEAVQGPGESPLSAAEQAFNRLSEEFEKEERGYFRILTTRPESLAFALADSPAGLAGWVVEKLRVWSDCGGELGGALSIEEILTSLSITWLTETIASSQRLYYECAHGDWMLGPNDRFDVRTGVLKLPGGLPYEAAPEETLRRRFNNLEYLLEAPRGGHWPAWETPEIFVGAVRDFYRPVRTRAQARTGQGLAAS